MQIPNETDFLRYVELKEKEAREAFVKEKRKEFLITYFIEEREKRISTHVTKSVMTQCNDSHKIYKKSAICVTNEKLIKQEIKHFMEYNTLIEEKHGVKLPEDEFLPLIFYPSIITKQDCCIRMKKNDRVEEISFKLSLGEEGMYLLEPRYVYDYGIYGPGFEFYINIPIESFNEKDIYNYILSFMQ